MPAPVMLLETARVAYMPPDGALHGPMLDALMRWNLIVLIACFVASHLWLVAGALKRKKKTAFATATAENPDRSLRSVRWLLLAVLCAMYAWMAITAQRLWAANRFEGPSLEAMQVEVIGQQFQWYFRYPGRDATFGATEPQLANAVTGNPLGIDARDMRGADDVVSSVLVLPAGREVDLRLRSLDVIHGFFVPGMRLKQNAVPGLLLHVHFTPTTVGAYPILCSQVCGLGHARMEAQLKVVSPADYEVWFAERERARLARTEQ